LPKKIINNNEETMLEVKNLTNNDVKNISFELKKGEILGFAGLVGAGRTEVARAIFGADPLQEGDIYIKGKKVEIKQPSDAVELGIGYLSEDRKQFGLMVEMDVKQNIMISTLKEYTKFLFVRKSKLREISEEYKKRLDIRTPSIDQKTNY